MLNGKFIATSSLLGILTKGEVYEFVNGITTIDSSYESCRYESLDDFYNANRSYTGKLEPYIEPETKTHVQITNKLDPDDSTFVEFKFVDKYSEVVYKATGDKLNYLPNMINEFVEFAKHLGFKEETIIRFMKEFVESSEV